MHAFASTDNNNDSMCTASTQAVATSNGDTAVKLETQNAISDGIDAGQVEIVTLASTSSGKASPGDEPGSSGTEGPGMQPRQIAPPTKTPPPIRSRGLRLFWGR